MNFLRARLQAHPALARILPFAIFLVLTSGQGSFFTGSEYWLYLIKTLLGAWLVWEMRRAVPEMRWAFSWEAVAVGVAVFVVWVGLDPYYRKIGSAGTPWNPPAYFPESPALAWSFVLSRIIGSTLIVPPLEEVFYRSFLYRNVVKPDWQSVPLNQFHWPALLLTAGVFGFVHPQQWLAGLACGLGFQLLVLRKNRLGDAMTAHAVTNLLLALWVISKPAWHFW